MEIYGVDGAAILDALVTRSAEHEEELMKSDFVRLSWRDASRYVIKAGAYVIPYPDTVDLDGNPVRYTLFRDYTPEQLRPGEYNYKPEFQHPKMWLGYVPFLFATKDAAGNNVKKTEYEYIGNLGTLLTYICDYINESFGYNSNDLMFVIQPVGDGIDMNETVTVKFDDDDVLSAIDKVCEVTGYEYHLSWPQRLFYFGSIYLGGEVGSDSEYELEIGRNIGVPKVTESKEKQYNRFYVQGGTRNNAVQGEHGNTALGTRLLLDEMEYPGSIIDTRPVAERNAPGLTGIITLDEVYPHLELYLYDLHERHKYKTDDSGNVTTEPWSVWYFKLAYLNSVAEGSIGTAVVGGVTKYWHDFALLSDPKTSVTEESQSQDDPVVGTDLPIKDLGFPIERKDDGLREVEQRVATVRKRSGGSSTSCKVGVRSGLDHLELVEYFDDEGEHQDSKEFLRDLHVRDDLEIVDKIDLDNLPYSNVTTYAIDGLPPSLGFLYNDSGANANALGTREFEIKYNSAAVTFDAKDDVAGQTGVGAGYYEIIHITEGSDSIIIPTPSGSGSIAPYAVDDTIGGHVVPSTSNSKAQLFNVVIGDEYKAVAKEELKTKANAAIARIMADQNHYTANANPVVFEEHKPDIVIGRRVAFDDAAGYRINSRIIRLVTKLDFDFDTEITFGNTLMKRLSDRIMAQIAKLGSGTGGYDKIDFTPEAQQVTIVEYPEWVSGGSYFFETVNRKTGVIETSHVWHRGCLWECKKTLTVQEPWFLNSDWQCLRANNVSLGFFTPGSDPTPIIGLSVRPGNIDETVQPYLLIGQEDISSIVTEWTWARNDGETASDQTWGGQHTGLGARTLHLTTSDFPTGWETGGGRVSFRCTATFPFDGDYAQISNQITVR